METKALFNTETTQWPTFQQAQISLILILKNVSTFANFKNENFI